MMEVIDFDQKRFVYDFLLISFLKTSFLWLEWVCHMTQLIVDKK